MEPPGLCWTGLWQISTLMLANLFDIVQTKSGIEMQSPLFCGTGQMRTDVLSLLAERADSLPALLDEIQQERIPLVLLGSGALGTHLYEVLTKRGIRVHEVAVHRKYWRDGQRLAGREVAQFEQVLGSYPEVNVFCAIQYVKSTAELRDNLLSSGKVGRVFIYDTGCTHWGVHAFNFDTVAGNREAFSWLYDELADQRSRETLIAYLNQRISGRPGYLEPVYDPNHLFPPEVIKLKSSEIFMDCGAFDGESILDFYRAMNRAGFTVTTPIYALEPDARNREQLVRNCRELKTLEVLHFGAWDRKTTLRFSEGTGATSRIGESGGAQVKVDTIDNLLRGKPVTYIKMDIEGAETEALRGAAQTIRQYRPKLGICIYHKPADVIEIPRQIRSLNPDYKLYLRAHSYGANDVLLYAV